MSKDNSFSDLANAQIPAEVLGNIFDPKWCDLNTQKENFIFESGRDYHTATKEDLWKSRYSINTKLRVILSSVTILIVATWLWKVGEILVNNRTYGLSENVLITLLTTTTFNVLGILYIVLRDLFNGISEK